MAIGGGIAESLAAEGIWSGAVGAFRYLRGRQIKITEPGHLAILKDPAPLGAGTSFRVRGKLRHLPKDHRIWLLVENEKTSEIWPQGFKPVQYNPTSGEWEGRVNPWDRQVLIHAVVAPPTADDLFRYFQQVGDQLTKWKPLHRIPPECVNRAAVQASKP